MSKGSKVRRFKKKDPMDTRGAASDPEEVHDDAEDRKENQTSALDIEDEKSGDAEGSQEDSGEEEEESEAREPAQKSPEKKASDKKSAAQKCIEKKDQHIKRVKRTLIACIMGVIAGGLSFMFGGTPDAMGIQPNTFLAMLLLLAGIVFQKHIFTIIGLDITELGKKDWFYQGFMTFALWFITWTILLTTSIL